MFKVKTMVTLGALAMALALLPMQSVFAQDTGGDTLVPDGTVWGTQENPQITVIDAKKLKIDGGAQVTGYGTLIVYGNLDIHHGSLDFTGNIIIMGESPDGKTKEAKLQNHHGTLNIDGTVILLGNGKGKAKLHIHNTNKVDDGGTNITGAVLLFSGSGNQKDKAEFKAKHGNLNVDGLVAIIGDKVKVDLHPENKKKKGTQSINIQGGLIVAVPDDGNGNQKADVKLHGNVTVQYDSVKVANALAQFAQFIGELDELVPPKKQYALKGGWRRFSPDAPPQ